MSQEACRATVLAADVHKRAPSLDVSFPNCFCEPWSLAESHPAPLADDELIARILTSPDGYCESTNTILRAKLTWIYTLGLSFIRTGASDQEILGTIGDLINVDAEQRKLVGAVVLPASRLRRYDDPDRWFGVYATDDRQKTHHADVFGTFPTTADTSITKSQEKKTVSTRRYQLAGDMLEGLILANEPADLIAKLRNVGF